ncbi:MAG: aldo/keto reductase, partial [Phycisphaerae bacterium]|nr:aldo/keto reductase [Phycisphaerae bacterium]
MLTPRPLGRTGLKVSPLGLGTVKLGRNRGVKYPAEFEIPTDVQAAELLRRAQKLGITLLDTAPAYGEAEERIGRIIGSCGGRDRWTIVTKAGEEFDPA